MEFEFELEIRNYQKFETIQDLFKIERNFIIKNLSENYLQKKSREMQPAKPKRLVIEGQEMTTTPPEGVTVLTDDNNPLKWEILIAGPKSTPYEGGVFKLSCLFPENYPFRAPSIKFESKIYHPNVNKDTGEICQDIYEKDWVPTKKVSGVVLLIISMLLSPNVDSPIEASIAEEFRNNKAQFDKNAREWTQKYANK